jgi:hypothetical protein
MAVAAERTARHFLDHDDITVTSMAATTVSTHASIARARLRAATASDLPAIERLLTAIFRSTA